MLPVPVACDPTLFQLIAPSPPDPGRAWRVVGWFLAATVFAGFVWPAPRVSKCWSTTKVDIAMLTVTKYANEGFPQWVAAHPDRACPVSLFELDPYLGRAYERDPWGRDYMFTCGGGKLYVVSLGMDGRSNTADDIWSHQ